MNLPDQGSLLYCRVSTDTQNSNIPSPKVILGENDSNILCSGELYSSLYQEFQVWDDWNKCGSF